MYETTGEWDKHYLRNLEHEKREVETSEIEAAVDAVRDGRGRTRDSGLDVIIRKDSATTQFSRGWILGADSRGDGSGLIRSGTTQTLYRKACPACGGPGRGPQALSKGPLKGPLATAERFAENWANRRQRGQPGDTKMKTIPYPVEIRFSPTSRDSPANQLWRSEYPLEDAPADMDELERWAVVRDFEPILSIPAKHTRYGFDEPVHEATPPWEVSIQELIHPKLAPPTRLEQLEDELENTLIQFDMVKERLPGRAKYLVLKHLRMGLIGWDDITSDDMRALARLDRKARQLQRQISRVHNHRDSRV